MGKPPNANQTPRVVHIQRRPFPAQFSVESIFDRLRSVAEADFVFTKFVVPRYSKGVINRLRNILAAANNQHDVNHITGDIHYVAALLRKGRTLLTVHDCENLFRTKGLRRAILRLFWFTIPVRRCKLITVVSEETKRLLIAETGIDQSLIRVIPNSVSKAFLPHPSKFDSGCPRILQVGTKHNKNVNRLVAAIEGIHCHLDIVGPLTSDLRSLLNKHRVSFTQSEALNELEMVEKYRRADMVTLVSTHEGFGMPVVEAQWVERPVVTSNVSSLPEVAGDGACLVDPFDVASIRAGIQRVISDSEYRDTLVRRGRVNRVRFLQDVIARQYHDLYREIARQEGVQL